MNIRSLLARRVGGLSGWTVFPRSSPRDCVSDTLPALPRSSVISGSTSRGPTCGVYRRNRGAVLAAARKHLPADIRYTVPAEGMSLWFEMPAGFDAGRMIMADGMDLGVLLIPGESFSTTGG